MINHVTISSIACPHPYVNESPWRTTEIHLGERLQPKQTRSFESQKRRRPPPPSASGLFPTSGGNRARTGLPETASTHSSDSISGSAELVPGANQPGSHGIQG